MDVSRALFWFYVALVCSSVAAYLFGFRAAEPTTSAFAMVGAVAIAVLVFVMALQVKASLQSLWPYMSLHNLSVGASIGPVWSGVVVSVGIVVGGFLGYHLGFRTAQSVSDFLSGLGVVVTLVAVTVVLVGITSTKRRRYR